MTIKIPPIGKENYYAINLCTNRIEWIGFFKSKGFANRTARAMFKDSITLNQKDLTILINTGISINAGDF